MKANFLSASLILILTSHLQAAPTSPAEGRRICGQINDVFLVTDTAGIIYDVTFSGGESVRVLGNAGIHPQGLAAAVLSDRPVCLDIETRGWGSTPKIVRLSRD